jgi:hypothetical protein
MNKHKYMLWNYAAGLITVFALNSCGTIPGDWSFALGRRAAIIVELGTVRVDKYADWNSVEAEARRFLPLLLAKKGYVVSDTEENRYRIDAVLIEREYMENWKTRRSLSAEVLIWKRGEAALPLSAGGTVLTGSRKSLSSSKVVHDLMRSAIANAIKGLPKK